MLKKLVEGAVFGCGFALALAAIWTAWSFGIAYLMPRIVDSAMTTGQEPELRKEFSFFKDSAERMKIPPGGGILAMSPMNTVAGSARPSTYQLWLTDSKLWQVRTVGEKVEIEELPYPENASIADLDKLMRKSRGFAARQSSMTVSADELGTLKSGGGSSRDGSLNGKLRISGEGVVFVQPDPYQSIGLANAKEVCGGSDAAFYDDGLIFHLSKAGVPYRKMHGSGLCVDEKYSAQFKAAQREIDRYFPQIAHNPKDACEERALVAWAQKEKLRFDLRPVFDSQKRPAGNLFFLRSFTQEEMESNREKLERSAPRGATCKK
jgi:hypothetical protein